MSWSARSVTYLQWERVRDLSAGKVPRPSPCGLKGHRTQPAFFQRWLEGQRVVANEAGIRHPWGEPEHLFNVAVK